LDLAATREVLETQGVTVVGYEVDELPAFYSRSSGLPVDVRADSPEAVAMIIAARQQLEMKAAILVGVPAPESDAMTTDAIEPTIQQATEEAEAKGIIGPASTPWLLARVAEISGGESQRANVALLKNNGYVAARIAVAFAMNK
jgi:pseudouridine-5'-phosphate glycosidase